jgi:hypothetical protein
MISGRSRAIDLVPSLSPAQFSSLRKREAECLTDPVVVSPTRVHYTYRRFESRPLRQTSRKHGPLRPVLRFYPHLYPHLGRGVLAPLVINDRR